MAKPDRVIRVRADLQVRVLRLGDGQEDDLSAVSTPRECLAMVETLSKRMWLLTGLEIPAYRRADIPLRVLRG